MPITRLSTRNPFGDRMSRLGKQAALALLFSFGLTRPSSGAALEAVNLDEVVVTAPYGAALSQERIPGHIQSADAQQIEQSHALDLTDFLGRNVASVHINSAQNNPLQPDVNFRGFTASPLLGLPQGLAIYQ